MKQDVFVVATDKRSVPANTAGTGTIVTFGKSIVGTSTLFKTEMKAGSYLVSETQGEICRVIRVDSDTIAFLETSFTSDLASAAPSIIKWFAANPVEINLKKVSGTPTLNGAIFTGEVKISKSSRDRSSRRDLVEPVILDASSGSVEVNILY